ncbi:fumarylacetoacetate hydrolase protein [Rutstroemia sp. NJR-2017a BVV2]|nr:fumarylacetoacetate hydrolase protein [Rutstroemia sp. NJR-2017a BVV2]
MQSWTHAIRFIAKEDHQIHIGQLVDTSQDVGIATFEGKEVKAYEINGTLFNGKITKTVLTVQQLLSPIDRSECNFIRCLGLNYRDHATEANLPLPKAPILFTKPRTALAGPYPATINVPKAAQDGSSDYEAELCLVIGKTGRDISEEDALDYVLGYTASNDVSARVMQLLTSQWSFSKGLDSSCPIGPVLVSPSVIPDPQALKIKAIYDGQTVQDGHTKYDNHRRRMRNLLANNTRDMIFNIRQQISYLSQGTTLEAGSIFLTGTPAGIGYFRDPKVVLKDGGDIRIEIEKIGTLINKVRYEG